MTAYGRKQTFVWAARDRFKEGVMSKFNFFFVLATAQTNANECLLMAESSRRLTVNMQAAAYLGGYV